MSIPTWATTGHTIVELSQSHSRRSGTVIGWQRMADRSGLFPLVRWSNPAYGVSFANPDWIEPPFAPFATRRVTDLFQVGNRVKLVYPDHRLGQATATIVDLCHDAAELRDEQGRMLVYPLTDLMVVGRSDQHLRSQALSA